MSAPDEILSFLNTLRDMKTMRRIAERYVKETGVPEAVERFASAPYDGTNDVAVTQDDLETGSALVARSDGAGGDPAVAFIEFGSGIRYSEYAGDYPEELAPRGTFGKGQGGTGHRWTYRGGPGNPPATQGEKHYFRRKDGAAMDNGVYLSYGNPPANAMFYAQQELETNTTELARIAKDVIFG